MASSPSPPTGSKPTGGESPSKGGVVKFVLFIAALATMTFVVTATDVGRFFTQERLEALLADEGRALAAVMYVGLYTVGTVITVPGTILSLIGGAFFGVWLGTGLVVVGATVGATMAFFIARFMARDFVAQRFGKVEWVERIDRGIAEEGIWFILFIRLVPLFPFNWINYAAGLTRVRNRDFILGTAIGVIPGSFVYVNVAAQTADAVSQGMVTPEVTMAFGLLGLLALVPILYRKMTHREKEKTMSDKDRLPPGQRLTKDFPILHFGGVPTFHIESWTFRIFGEVEEEKTLTYDQFTTLPTVEETADFHCVTGWSRYDNRWTGVTAKTVAGLVAVKPNAAHVLIHCEQNYTTNLPIAEFLDDDVLFAWGHDGADLTPDHGYPLRLVVPKLYAWKSAKWVRGIEFMTEDQRGFWESYGYHNHGDPWTEERYSSQE